MLSRSKKNPTRLQWLEHVKAVRHKRPNWTPAKRRFMRQWAQEGLRSGLLEAAPESRCVNRTVLVRKANGKIRVCLDLVDHNKNIAKLPPNYADPHAEMRRLALARQ